MESVPQRRKVLVLKADDSIRKLFNLMKQMERENVVKGGGETTLARIHSKRFDEVIVDLRFRHHEREKEIHGIGDIRPSVIGKMLTVTLEVNGPKTSELVERYLMNRLPLPLLWLVRHR